MSEATTTQASRGAERGQEPALTPATRSDVPRGEAPTRSVESGRE
jgi:hypothetical protein